MLIKDVRKEFYDYVITSRSRLLVLVGYDLDSISATKILQYLLECHRIQYTIIPVKDKHQLLQSFQEHRDGLNACLLINIGNTFHVGEWLMPANTCRIFICDTRRPINVFNAYASDVYLMTDITGLNSFTDEANIIPAYDDIFTDSDDDLDDEDIDRRQLSLQELEKRRSKKKNRYQWETKRNKLLFDYTEKTYCSYSTALLIFDLSWKLSKDNNDLLWLAILGVSDQMINVKISQQKYDEQYQYIKEAMTRLKNIRGEPTIALNRIVTNADQNVITNHNHLKITYEKDLKLSLYRHWSLYDSLRHTMYISNKFKIWRLRGHKRLLAFLAELGLPLSQCKQKFSSMDLELRSNVKQWIEDLSNKYQLQSIIGYTFIASRGFKDKYNCNDMAFAVRALLESADKDKRANQKFFDAIDSLSWNNIQLLEKGLDLAKLQLSAILKQVQIIVDSKQIQLLNDALWYVIISETTPDANFFCYSGCLNQLSQYVLHALAATNPKSKKSVCLPLVMISPNPNRSGMAMACGIPPIKTIHKAENFFSEVYVHINRRLKDFQLEHDLVDPCVAHLPYTQALTFLNELAVLFA
ncbi:cell division control protein 45 homolog [Oppia nitens]|uniref:cell division control protein 45 homolog n=1 Tax=Oppia nitens TaxID=1686743 RepID=UPI0023DB89B3|nr:cell division control protein 45 homolog [Oppia nitens]